MNFIDKILNEAKNNFDPNKLYSIVEKYRTKMEEEHEWSSYKSCFKGTCQDIVKHLKDHLEGFGYNPSRVRGYYKNADEDFEPNMNEWDWDEKEFYFNLLEKNGGSANGLKFPHWWVEVENYIIDVTEDQFHPGYEDEYRIGFYKKPNSYYKKWN